jgi:bifunctional DNase/RNase
MRTCYLARATFPDESSRYHASIRRCDEGTAAMIEVFVQSIRVNMTNYKRVVMLKEKTGERYQPLWIGHFEADAIAIPMQNVPTSRPLTHDLLTTTIASLGGTVTQASISELTAETFYARLIVDLGGRRVELDCRPSDAISVAIRAKVPIFVEDAIMAQAAMTFDPGAPSDASSPPDASARRPRRRASHAAGPLADAAPAGPAHLPGAEPLDERPGEPFGQLGTVTEPLLATLRRVLENAEKVNRRPIGPGDLLLALLLEGRAAAGGILRSLSVDPDELETLIDREIPRDYPEKLTPMAGAVLQRAAAEASYSGERTVGTEHLLLALSAQPESSVAVVLDQLGISTESIRRQIAVLLAPPPPSDDPRAGDQPEDQQADADQQP